VGRKGESKGASLPPGRRRDLQQAVITLQKDAGGVSQADIARHTGRSKSTVSNVFSGRRVQQRDSVLAVVFALAMRLPASSRTQEELLDELGERFQALWIRAKEEENAEHSDAPAPGSQSRPSREWPRVRLPAAARKLLFSLSSDCTICHATSMALGVHHILGVAHVMNVARQLGGQDGPLRAASHAGNPWELIMLCPNCNYRAAGGDIDVQQLREERLRLDRQPGAPRLYEQYLEQILRAEDKEFLDLNAVASAMAIAHK
jgi:transcriptional regulator with XRE-family HTH domain